MANNNLLRNEYTKARKNLLARKRALERQGYHFSGNIIPKIPKRITSSAVSRLKEITTSELKREATEKPQKALPKVLERYYQVAPKAYEYLYGKPFSTYKAQQKATKGKPSKKQKKRKSRPEDNFYERNRQEYKKGSNRFNGTEETLTKLEEEISNWQPLSGWSEANTATKLRHKNRLSDMLNQAIAEADTAEATKFIDEFYERYGLSKTIEMPKPPSISIPYPMIVTKVISSTSDIPDRIEPKYNDYYYDFINRLSDLSHERIYSYTPNQFIETVDKLIKRQSRNSELVDYLKQGKETFLPYVKELYNFVEANRLGDTLRSLEVKRRSGREVVAERIFKHSEDVSKLTEEILYKTSGGKGEDLETRIGTDFTILAGILFGRTLTPEESIEYTALSELTDNTPEEWD